jgi:uncharacterized phage protein (TIGR01671 family)
MRELKARVWDEQTKRFLDEDEALIGLDGTVCQNEPMSYRGDNEGLIVELFTGLHDKNGARIYDGDIVRRVMKGLRPHKARPGVVYGYDPAKGIPEREVILAVEVDLVWGTYPFNADENEALSDSRKWEVVGNIHQNPELLTKGTVC